MIDIKYNHPIIDLNIGRMFGIHDFIIDFRDNNERNIDAIDALIHRQKYELFILLDPIMKLDPETNTERLVQVVATNLGRVGNVLYGTLIIDIPKSPNIIQCSCKGGIPTTRRVFLDKNLIEVPTVRYPVNDRVLSLDTIVYTMDYHFKKITLPRNEYPLISTSKSRVMVVGEPSPYQIVFDVGVLYNDEGVHYLLGRRDSNGDFHPYDDCIVRIVHPESLRVFEWRLPEVSKLVRHTIAI